MEAEMTLKISRDGKPVGILQAETLAPHTSDRRLRQLFRAAKTEGMKHLSGGATLADGSILDFGERVKLKPRHYSVVVFMSYILAEGYTSEIARGSVVAVGHRHAAG